MLFLFLCSFSVSAQDIPAAEAQLPEKEIKIQPQNKPKDLTAYLQQQEAKAKACNLEAIRLFEEGRYEEAQQKWQEAIAILEHPERDQYDYLLEAGESESGAPLFEEAFLEAPPQTQNIGQEYERGMSLFEQKRYQEAKEVFAQIDNLSPGYKDAPSYILVIEELIQKDEELTRQRQEQERLLLDLELKKQEEDRQKLEEEELKKSAEEREIRRLKEEEEKTGSLYRQAVDFYKNGRLQEAKAAFEELQAIHPRYKFTPQYLDRINKDIKEREKKSLEEKIRQESLEREREEEELRELAAQNEKALAQEVNKEAEDLYQQGKTSYERGDLEKAKFYFDETKKLLPDYRSTVRYLMRIDQEIAKEQERQLEEKRRRQTLESHRRKEQLQIQQSEGENERKHKMEMQAEVLYQEAKDFYRRRDLTGAKQRFKDIEKIISDYKSTQKFLARIEEDIASERRYQDLLKQAARERRVREKTVLGQKQERAEFLVRREKTKGLHQTLGRIKAERQRRLQERADSLYVEGTAYYKAGLPEMARECFEEVERIYPRYKSASKYLTRIENDLKVQELRREKERKEQVRAQQAALEKQASETAALPITKSSQQIDAIYREGILLFRHKYYEESREKFLTVLHLDPAYKSASKYLERIRREGSPQRPPQREESFEAFARTVREEKLARKNKGSGNETEAPETALPESEKQLVEKAQQQRREKFLKAAQEKYERALAFYQAGNFVKAQEEFIAVEAFLQGFKDTQDYLSRLDEDIEKERLRAQEKTAAQQIETEKPPQAAGVRQEFEAKAERLFQQAVKFWEDRKLTRAKQKFIEVDRLVPGYKDTGNYLEKIDRALAESPRKEVHLEKQGQASVKKTVEKQRKPAAQERTPEKEIVEPKTAVAAESLTAKKRQMEGVKEAGAVQTSQPDFRRQRQKIQRLIQEKLAKQYSQAVDLYQRGSYRQSRELFAEIERLSPAYKKTRHYIVQIDHKLPSEGLAAPPVEVKTRMRLIAEALDTAEQSL